MSWLLVAAPTLPLAGALGALLVERSRAGIVATAAATAALACVLVAGTGHDVGVPWIATGGYELAFGLRSDGLSWTASILVTAVGALVMLYATGYMAGRERQRTFFAWMSFFVGSMLALVLASTLLALFVAWEMVGVASFALIGFHHEDERARAAATKALLVTRAADLGLFAAWLLVLHQLGTTDIGALHDAAQRGVLGTSATVIALLLVVAALGKAAQLPLSTWLPDAMTAPTPVSALLHSATMVAAGVYLVLRTFPLFTAAPIVLLALAWIGLATALFGALAATAEMDLKRLLAWSTVAHLGEMMLALGLHDPAGAMHLLIAHAAFKAGLFLAAGLFERATSERELSRLQGAARAVPWAGGAFLACALALAAVPPLSAYWSVRAELAAASRVGPGWSVALVCMVALGGIYIGRATTVLWLPGRRSIRPPQRRGPMLAGSIALAAAALSVGWLAKSPLERVLPFAPAAEAPPIGWHVALVLASVGGLAFGIARVRWAGAAPAFGSWPRRIPVGLDALLRGAVRAALLAARAGVDPLERALDRGAASLGGALRTVAGGVDGAERRGLDRGASISAASMLRVAGAVEAAEQRAFAEGGDGLACALARSGAGLRRLEVGKVTLYLGGLFGSALVLAIVFVVLWSLAGGS